ncbi:hypothetical protein [Modestobacter versicolor]|uniref:Uncharacterized protein n=1 Tax=Modestobacter versicolor TaxID=429133 RepID=A0A323V425_9ACTN|nr:hypothetical protein [Modestobacter versicolor]MBB3675352.1 hypothetical protein [Modestobacter versicolor]PZA19454.1 hypothetical protein DMO24_20635 [Modestobacter versicolor]
MDADQHLPDRTEEETVTEPAAPRPVPGPPRPAPGPVAAGARPGPPGAAAGTATSPAPGAAPSPAAPGAAPRFADLADRPVAEHVAVFEAEHDRLQRELSTIDQL